MLIKSAGHTLAAGFLIATGSGFLMLAGAGIAQAETAQAQPESASVCQKLTAALTNLNEIVQEHPSTLKAKAATVSAQLTQAAQGGSPAVQHDVRVFVTDLQAGAAANDLNFARLTAEGYAFAIAACTPSGAPATGGGSSAGWQDPVLFGVGGAAALAGIVVVSVAVRGRPRAGASAV
jgi:hypothetical protein